MVHGKIVKHKKCVWGKLEKLKEKVKIKCEENGHEVKELVLTSIGMSQI